MTDRSLKSVSTPLWTKHKSHLEILIAWGSLPASNNASMLLILGIQDNGRESCGEWLVKIDLQWTDNSDNDDYFAIERKTEDGFFSEIGTVGADETYWQDKRFSYGFNYSYRARAFNYQLVSWNQNSLTK